MRRDVGRTARCVDADMGYRGAMSNDDDGAMSNDDGQEPLESARSDRDDELDVDADDAAENLLVLDASETTDADRALHEAGGDADRAEDLVEARRRSEQLFALPDDERRADQ
ncbi:MAG: hypothetical protein JWM12_1996 [Ilumatobacteraceae bacterium]|nr:hypothetical protein [Ilumatobacteraceae bacterium]